MLAGHKRGIGDHHVRADDERADDERADDERGSWASIVQDLNLDVFVTLSTNNCK